ncbi:MAG: hypothetical protein JRE18_02775 [Deltaproteobacteria bacterium]|nr:hypothetical protein [Deltaproteobacteria bacterium]
MNVSTLRQQLEDSDRVHGIITYGGAAPNIIPAVTEMAWYVRAATQERLDLIYPRVVACFEAAAIATGCTYEVTQAGHAYSELISDALLVDLYAANSEAIGRRMHRLNELPPETSGSTDMGNVSQVVPSIHPMLDLHCYPAVNHQPEFAAHTTTPDGEAAMRDGALAMAWSIIDLADGDRWDELGGS